MMVMCLVRDSNTVLLSLMFFSMVDLYMKVQYSSNNENKYIHWIYQTMLISDT